MDTPEEFAEMAIALQAEPDAEETLSSILDFARDALASDHAGIHLVVNSKIETAGATDDVIFKADQLQSDLGEGPCIEAVLAKSTFVVHDTENDARWPNFGPYAAELGLYSILSVQLQTADRTFGALNFYCSRPREFDADDIATAEVFAIHASVALATARREDGLKLAISARESIGQAQGILMERFNLNPGQAFAVLQRYSQNRNVKLRIVAQQLVETRQLPS